MELTVDTGIVMSAGNSQVGEALDCDNVLEAIVRNTLFVTLTLDTLDEWSRHANGLSLGWLEQCVSRKLVRHRDPSTLRDRSELRSRIIATASNLRESQAIIKDLFLIEAALLGGQRILSLDRNARMLFSRAAGLVNEIRDIMWANPCETADSVITWIDAGVPVEARRRLSAAPPARRLNK